MKMYKAKEITSFKKGVVYPILAMIGSFIILTGAIQTPVFIYYVIFVVIIYIISQIYYQIKKS